MKKQKRNRIIVGIVLFAILFFVINAQIGLFEMPFAVAPSDLDQYVGTCSGGWTTLSMSDVNIQKIGDRIRVFGIAKGSECLKIDFRQNELNEKLSSMGLEATKDVIGSIRLLEYTKTFPIDQRGGFVGKFDNFVLTGTTLTYPLILSGESLVNVCKNKGYSQTLVAYRPFAGYNIRCVLPGQDGIAGDFASARSYGDFRVQFKFDGSSTTIVGKNIQKDSDVVKNANLRGEDIRIEWTGNLLNLDEVGFPQWDARLGSKWHLVQKGALQDINRERDKFIQCLKNYWSSGDMGDSYFDICRSDFNTASLNILRDTTSTYKNDMKNLVYDTSTDKNALYVSLKSSPYPAFTIDLNAESVGIIALEGKPKITQCIPSNLDLSSGKNQIVSYSVRNDANVNNVEFITSITCNRAVNPFSTSFQIDANEEKTQLTAELIPTNPNPGSLSFSCALKVTDLKSGKSDTCGFTGNVEYESGIICQSNSKYCSKDKKYVMQCSSEGLSENVIQECLGDSSCGFKDNKYQCVKDDDVEKGFFEKLGDNIKNFFKNIFDFTGNLFSILKNVVVFLVFIFATLIGSNFFSSFRNIRDNKAVIWISSLLIAGALAYLVYAFFWIGLILFGIFIIIRFAIGLTPMGGLTKMMRKRR